MERSPKFDQAERAYLESVGVAATERFVESARLGGAMRVLEAGDGPPVVFVHGVMTAGASWGDLVALLPDFRCILLDRPGCGLSTLPATPPEDLAAQQNVGDHFLADLVDGLGLAAVDVVSTSLGGWYTFRSAAAHPDRVRRIVGMGFQVGAPITGVPFFMRLQAPTSMMPRRPRVSRRVIASMLKMAGMRRAVETGAFSDTSLDWMMALLTETDTMYNDMTTQPRPFGLLGARREVEHGLELLGRVAAPVHLFWGDEDPFGDESSAHSLAEMLPTATVEMVSPAGHAPWLDAPDQAAAAVRRHLRS